MPTDHIKKIVEAQFDAEQVAAVYLFGSFATGRSNLRSDVDLGVLYRLTPPATILDQPYDAEAELEQQIGRPVQIVVMNRAPADLVHRILRDGILVCEYDRSQRVAFEVQARNRYWDLKPILDLYRSKVS